MGSTWHVLGCFPVVSLEWVSRSSADAGSSYQKVGACFRCRQARIPFLVGPAFLEWLKVGRDVEFARVCPGHYRFLRIQKFFFLSFLADFASLSRQHDDSEEWPWRI